ncbi:trypsin-like serine protease [Staphylococcus agnetis]|uniref:trypsin-like serine protease n=1 Tax=Staphylococcus agnetis TaxID=985762 RepID=UPI00208F8F3E|nr:trypsin-like serine protease [Staphylococcus agnetis]MCO4361067.1 serine protease [Staphylococcus agnetis]MCO4365836.1 serine protease [Staphylococcus agnetis]
MKVKFSAILLAAMTLSNVFIANSTLAVEEGTQNIVANTQSDEVGRRVALFDGPKGHSCTAIMLTPNFGLTAAHCGNGFQEGNVGKVSPAQSARQSPFGSMNISLFNPYDNKDIAFVYGKDSDKSGDYKNYQKTFANKDLQLKGFTSDELKGFVGKKVYSFGYPYDYDGYKQYKFTGEITYADENAIHTTMPSHGGQSGSAVFLEGSNELIGILIRGGQNNKAIIQPITQDISNWYHTKKKDIESKN